MQSMNGVNLNQFPFDYDLTWMAFFQDDRGRTYTRYGGREDEEAESHLNRDSLVAVMQRVLQLHQRRQVQPVNAYEPAAGSVHTAEDIPPMKTMLARREVKCIHCHDVKAARLRDRRDRGTLTKDMVFAYPSPQRLGIHLDAVAQQRVRKVDQDSAAHRAGVRAGDQLQTIDGQRVITFGDATRVLELVPKTGGATQLTWLRDGKEHAAAVRLPGGWHQGGDPSWRSSTGAVGPSSGFWGKRANAQQRSSLGIGPQQLAIQVNFIWSPWAKRSGVQHGDVVISVDGNSKDMTIRQLQSYLHLNRDWGEVAKFTVRRGQEVIELELEFPSTPPQ